MKKKWFILIPVIFISVACITYFSLSYFSKTTSKEVVQTVETNDEYEQRITELETEITELKEELTVLDYLEQRNNDIVNFLNNQYGVNFPSYH